MDKMELYLELVHALTRLWIVCNVNFMFIDIIKIQQHGAQVVR